MIALTEARFLKHDLPFHGVLWHDPPCFHIIHSGLKNQENKHEGNKEKHRNY